MQKIMKLCDCPKDICRADSPTDTCRFIVDPHDRLRLDIAKNFVPVVAKEKKHWADEFNEVQEAKDKRIADLQRQLAEAKAEIDKWKTSYEYANQAKESAWSDIKEFKAEIEAMRPMVEACRARYELHHTPAHLSVLDDDRCQCITCQWYRDYMERKQP